MISIEEIRQMTKFGLEARQERELEQTFESMKAAAEQGYYSTIIDCQLYKKNIEKLKEMGYIVNTLNWRTSISWKE